MHTWVSDGDEKNQNISIMLTLIDFVMWPCSLRHKRFEREHGRRTLTRCFSSLVSAAEHRDVANKMLSCVQCIKMRTPCHHLLNSRSFENTQNKMLSFTIKWHMLAFSTLWAFSYFCAQMEWDDEEGKYFQTWAKWLLLTAESVCGSFIINSPVCHFLFVEPVLWTFLCSFGGAKPLANRKIVENERLLKQNVSLSGRS